MEIVKQGTFPALLHCEAGLYEAPDSGSMNNSPKYDFISGDAGFPVAPENSGRSLPAVSRRVLVVDDEPAARVLAKRVFSEAGFEVVAVQSGFECLQLFRKQPHGFALILLDLSMPFMDGEETFKRLRDINPNVAVLLSTGFMAQERVDRMLAAGLSGFLRKPHRPDELLARVQGVLEDVKLSRAGCAASDMTASI